MPIFNNAKEKLDIEIEVLKNKPSSTEGFHKCKYCQGYNTESSGPFQKRSADEPMTMYVRCNDCEKGRVAWTE